MYKLSKITVTKFTIIKLKKYITYHYDSNDFFLISYDQIPHDIKMTCSKLHEYSFYLTG